MNRDRISMSVPRTMGVLAALGVLLGVWLFVMRSASGAAGALPVAPQAGSREPVQLLRSDATGIKFAVDISGFEIEQEIVDGAEYYDVVRVPGFGSSSEAGSPQVPTRRILLGIPLSVDYQLRVSVDESEPVPGVFRLLPAPTQILEFDDQDALLDPEDPASWTASWEYVEDERAYSVDAFHPQAVAKVAGTGFMRDQRYIAVQVNPLQYNPVSGEAILHRRIVVEINFSYEQAVEPRTSSLKGSFEPALSTSLLNYESASTWRGKQSSSFLPASLVGPSRDAGLPTFKIMVNEDGIYQVTAAELGALGIPVDDILTTTYKLYYRGQEVPIRVFGTESLESFWFYGEKARTKYTHTNVYWLTYDPNPLPGADPGLRMPSRSAPPVSPETAEISTYYSTTVRLEEDLLYRPQLPWIEDSDHWFQDYTRYPDVKPSLAVSFDIGNLASESYTAVFSAAIVGYTNMPYEPEHCVRFLLNGDPASLGSYLWSDDEWNDEHLVQVPFDGSNLSDGANELRVEGCQTEAPVDIVYYDWFEFAVRRKYVVENDELGFGVDQVGWQYRLDGFSTDAVEIFDVSGTHTAFQLADVAVTGSDSSYAAAFYDLAAEQGTRYLALTRDRFKSPLTIVEDTPSNLAATTNHADYIVIAPQEFMASMQPLVERRATQDLTVLTATLESIFDEFNYGIYNPEAIRDFLAYAYHNWSGEPPLYVLLVGDGTYDYKGNLSGGNPNLLPPYMAWVDPVLGETAADNRYVSVSGDDPFPDMHIGRLPAETTAQVTAMVAKTLAYETSPAPSDWTERILFVTDNSVYYYALSDDLVNNHLPEPYLPYKVYLASTCLTADACKQVILNTFNTTGALLINYIGHAAPKQWAHEALWTTNDLPELVPNDRYPVILAMACREGAFYEAEPELDALAESVVRLADRGAVASWSATGLSLATGHHYLDTGFFEAALSEGVRELGAAADAGKAMLFATGNYTDLLETYHLFGDPALRLNAVDLVDVAVGLTIDAPEEPLPGDLVTMTLAFTNTGPDVAAGVVVTDLLPSVLVTPTVVFSSPEVLAHREGITFAWTIEDLPPGAAGEIEIEATVDPSLPGGIGVSFFNEARIGVQASYDLVPQNNVARIGVNLKSVYLPLIMRGF